MDSDPHGNLCFQIAQKIPDVIAPHKIGDRIILFSVAIKQQPNKVLVPTVLAFCGRSSVSIWFL